METTIKKTNTICKICQLFFSFLVSLSSQERSGSLIKFWMDETYKSSVLLNLTRQNIEMHKLRGQIEIVTFYVR